MKTAIILCIGTGFLEILFFGGIIFGFPFLQYVLEQEGYFEYLCNKSISGYQTPNLANTSFARTTCRKQEANFNLAFTIGTSCLYLISFSWGIVLDRYGTWIFRTIVTSSLTLGYILLTLSSPCLSNLLYPVLILFGMSCKGIMMSNFQMANLAEAFRGSILTLTNGLFSSSVVVFFLVKKGYDYGTSLKTIVLILTLLSSLVWIRTYLILPKKIIPFPLPSGEIKFGWREISCFQKRTQYRDDLCSASSDIENSENTPAQNDETNNILFKDALKNVLFWTNMFHYILISVRISFFFSSVLTWLRSFQHPEQISTLIDEFGFSLFFGVCASPLNGIIIDFLRKVMRSSTPDDKILNLKASFVSMLITSVLSILHSVFVLLQSTYGTFVFHLLTRGFVHGGLSAFIASNFPFYHFGKLFGLTGLVTGIFGFSQYGIFQIVINFDTEFYYVNIAFLIACILTLIHPLVIYIQIKKLSELNYSSTTIDDTLGQAGVKINKNKYQRL